MVRSIFDRWKVPSLALSWARLSFIGVTVPVCAQAPTRQARFYLGIAETIDLQPSRSELEYATAPPFTCFLESRSFSVSLTTLSFRVVLRCVVLGFLFFFAIVTKIISELQRSVKSDRRA